MEYWRTIDTIEVAGLQFEIATTHDDDADAPWERNDYHGPVSEWTSRDKRPGELILASDRGARRYYDFEAAVAMAKRDGWGLSPAGIADWKRRRGGRPPTAAQIAETAARDDFARLSAWCRDQWQYVIVRAVLLTVEGEHTPEVEYQGGIADDAEGYIRDEGAYLAAEIARRVGSAAELTTAYRIRTGVPA